MTDNMEFRKSSYSGGSGNCVEVADLPGEAAVRDTQNRDLGYLAYPNGEWAALLATLKP
ncbi:uncharacterized protein DUF397 [Nocardiopsis sp. Huas11]|uniref:DUF397 domain-containing protein n=1 Tax=Nocardiopsis sp. Huas11 TaxID=2183912 RepID=UPI000EAC0876|nr:DUF397 domain-containing protein [Nocardiopsis sp. Huas11]RKS05954.1 uncharacterized protein DUF397 [Nocardiopsis sp. Huas11]